MQSQQVKTVSYSMERYVDDNPVRWIQKHFYIPETNLPITLHESQATPLTEALRRDEDGLFAYSTVVWSAIKKSAKSSIAAAVGLWFAMQKPYSTVRVIANDLKQAESRVYYYMRRSIELHPEWKNQCKVNLYKIYLPNGSIIEAVPIDPKGEAGGGDDCVIYSEIWGWKNAAAIRMWTESTLSPLKFGKSVRWCETYAGFTDDSPVLEKLYKTGVEEGRILNSEYEMYANDSARQFTLWNTKPHLKWQTEAYYNQERSSLDETEFDRVHRNKWQLQGGRVYPSFDPLLNVSEEAECNPNLPIIWGVDDGFAQGSGPGTESYHPRVFLLGQVTAQGGIHIFDEYYQTLELSETSLDNVLVLPYPRPSVAYVDSSAVELKARIHTKGIQTVGATHEVREGIKNLRRLVCDANGNRLLKIHPRCVQLRREMQRYRSGDTGVVKVGEQHPLKVDDHGPDALRYMTWHLRYGH